MTNEDTSTIVDIPINNLDIELFVQMVQDNNTFSWVFPDHNGNAVELRFMTEDEHAQRGK